MSRRGKRHLERLGIIRLIGYGYAYKRCAARPLHSAAPYARCISASSAFVQSAILLPSVYEMKSLFGDPSHVQRHRPHLQAFVTYMIPNRQGVPSPSRSL
ncbi:hypothetical protein AVEN_246600-1 [Araneus ventricosus]|uniref:Uncharacterized protein n=1 Tax=Araneus ventricosus TaxID=182803 RepID=A0A4Y2DCJ8_ARAVE|nr:hypothetical protein AVEN_246600-1 [Araneus ventricosus]